MDRESFTGSVNKICLALLARQPGEGVIRPARERWAGDLLPVCYQTAAPDLRRALFVLVGLPGLNLGPHPYQLTAGNRCADRRSRRSRVTVEGEVYVVYRRAVMRSPNAS